MSDSLDCFNLQVMCEVDARELRCPLPLLKAKQALRDLQEGDLLRVLTTDSASARDFSAFCQLSQHQLVGVEDRAGVYCYVLKK